jgi:colicin import membrane protein
VLPLDEIEKATNAMATPRDALKATPSKLLADAPVAAAKPHQAPNNSLSWGGMFKSQVERCWKKPYGGIEAQMTEAIFSIKLKRDGTLETAPTAISNPSTPFFRAYQQSALRAIIECQPYNLPAAYFDEWKFFEPVFTERKS